MTAVPSVSAPAPVPPLAARARSIGGSPGRGIPGVTARPEGINFAGGLPAPELFEAGGLGGAVRAGLAPGAGGGVQ